MSAENRRHTGFSPVMGDDPFILILGTFPSPFSREKGEYYGNPRNRFWPIIFDLFGEAFHSPSYAQKTGLLIRHHIALWDVIESCESDSALDSSIKHPSFNDICAFLKAFKGIRAVLCNGAASGAIYRRIGRAELPPVILPSTSPANARMTYSDKLQIWRGAFALNDNYSI